MKRLWIPTLVFAVAGTLPADDCRPFSSDPNNNPLSLSCIFKSMGEHRVQEIQMEYAMGLNMDRNYPPVIVDSRPGQRLAPREKTQMHSNAKWTEAYLGSLLDEFEAGLRARPQALLGFAHTHLATAWTLYAARHYMVLRDLEDVSPELVQYLYWHFRETNRSPAAAKFIQNASAVQVEYESLLLDSLQLDTGWQAAQSRSDHRTIEALQQASAKSFSEMYGNSGAELLRQLDAVQSRTRGNPVGRTTLRTTTPLGGWRQFDFQKSEDFEYKMEGKAGGQIEKGNVRIGVRVATNGDRTLTISAKIAGEAIEQTVTYKRAEGTPDFATLPWAQTNLGRLVVSLLLTRAPELSLRVLTSGQRWSTRNGQTEVQAEIFGQCKQAEGLEGQFVMGTIRFNPSAPTSTMAHCLSSDVPLPIFVKYAMSGAFVAADMVRRSAASGPAIPK